MNLTPRYISVYIWFDRKVTEGKQMWARTYNKDDLHLDFKLWFCEECLLVVGCLTMLNSRAAGGEHLQFWPFSFSTSHHQETVFMFSVMTTKHLVLLSLSCRSPLGSHPWTQQRNCEFYDFSEIYPGKEPPCLKPDRPCLQRTSGP